MASNTKQYDYTCESSDPLTNIRAIATFIASKIGATTCDEDVSDTQYHVYLKLSGAPNFAVKLSSSNSKIVVGYYHKTTSGVWQLHASATTNYGGGDNMSVEGNGIRVVSKTLGGVTMHTIYTVLGTSSATTRLFAVASASMVDYFTMKNREGLWGISSNGTYQLYVYNEDSCTASQQAATIVGGSTYPARNQSVATPVVFASTDFYGYVEKSTCLYKLYIGSTEANVDLDVQIKINGHTFEQLIPSYFVRLD